MVYIQLRPTLDWRDRAAVDAGLIEKFRPKVETWNATFNIPYHEFRQRLKAIAQSNLNRVENARFATSEAVPPGALLVPVDDDDWFAPHLADRLSEETDPSILGYYWIRHILEPGRHLRRWKGLLKEALTGKIILSTNNYALREGPGMAPLALHHLDASRYFLTRPRELKYLPMALSMHNRSLASQTVLAKGRPTITRDELIETYERYRTLYAGTRLSRDLRWAEPYVASMSELMDELKMR